MFGSSTEDARQMVLQAQEEALRRGAGKVTGGHLWRALLAHPDRAALLARLGIAADRLSEEIGRMLPPSGDPGRDSRFTRAAKEARLEQAKEEARAPGSQTIGREHLMFGLMRDDTAVAARYQDRAGVPLDDLRRAVATKGEEGI